MRSSLLVFCLLLAVPTPLLAQEAEAGPGDAYVGVVGFAYIESSEDDLSGASLGGGAVLGARLAPSWGVEAEVAVPAYFTDELRSHRDVSYSVLVGWHPDPEGSTDLVLLAGIGLLDGRTRSPLGEFSSTTVAAGLGADLRWQLGDRLYLVPRVRAHLGAGVFILRPGVGLHWSF